MENLEKRELPVDRVRVIGIFAHVDAGKTTASEGILYHTGRIHRVGRVDDGNAQLDWMAQERERGITITSAATTCAWQGCRINLIDTPGHIDFSAEVVRSIRVIDGAVMVLCGVGGVEPQTETVWMHADREGLPRVIFVNKLDRSGADFDCVMDEIRKRLTPDAVALQIPIGREGDFSGVVDLIEQRALIWREGADAPVVETPIPRSMASEVGSARTALLDAVCETDEALLSDWLEEREPDLPALQAVLRRATVAGQLVPVVCGSALKRVGIQPLLDAVVAYLPSPLDGPPVQGVALGGGKGQAVERSDRVDSTLCATAFKVVIDPHVGRLSWVRVFSGRLTVGERVYNPRADAQERVGRIYRMHANKRERADRVTAGDVVALVGVKSAVTGDTLCDPAHPVALEAFGFPDPVIMVALTPASDDEMEKLHRAVARLCEEDPTLIARFDPETREETLAGMGELHLEIAVDRLRTEFGVVPQVSRPQVAYLETVRRPAEATAAYQMQTGGHGHFARVHLRVEPTARGAGVEFIHAPRASPAEPRRHHGRHPRIPDEFVRPTELGVRQTLEKGILAGYPVTDVRITLLGGRFHEVDSAGKDFQIAGSMAVRQAVRKARPALLEPVMRLDIAAGETHLGAVMADFGRRRGRVKTMQVRGDRRHITGEAPLTEMRGYATDLRSLTQGRSTFTLALLRYDLVPEAVAGTVVDERREAGKIPAR